MDNPVDQKKIDEIIQKKIEALPESEKEQVLKNLQQAIEIIKPAVKKLDESIDAKVSLDEVTTPIQSSVKKIQDALNSLKLSDFLKQIEESVADIPTYQGVEIERYRKLRHIQLKEICERMELNKSTLNKYQKGQLDIPASKLIMLSYILNVSVDLLLKKEKRTLSVGKLTKDVPLYQFDYSKKIFQRTSLKYAMDNSVKDYIDDLYVVRFPKPIYELNLPANTTLFLTKGSGAIKESFHHRIAVYMKDTENATDQEFFSYIEEIQGKNKSYSSSTNFNYVKDGRTYTTSLKHLQESVIFVIHKAVIDF